MTVTLKKIAERVGKSIPTVSRALGDFDDISPKTREHIQTIAKEMGYVANNSARRLQKQRADAVGLILTGTENPKFSDPFFSLFLSAVIEKMSKAGLHLTISATSQEKELDLYIEQIRSKQVDGFIVVRTQRQDTRIELLQTHDIPFVAFGRMESGNDFNFVDEDSEWGIEQAVDHLVALGHRNLACIAEPLAYTKSFNRVQGFLKTLQKHRLETDPKKLIATKFRQQSGHVSAKQLLQLPDPPTAIVACNDLLALGAIQAAQECGLVVGTDISITGFDDTILAQMANPKLTTLQQPAYQMGKLVAQNLIKQLKNEPIAQPQLVLKPTFVIRQSTGRFVNRERS